MNTHRVMRVGVARCGCSTYWSVESNVRPQTQAEEIAARMSATNGGIQFAAMPVDGSVFYRHCSHYTGGPDAPPGVPGSTLETGTEVVPGEVDA